MWLVRISSSSDSLTAQTATWHFRSPSKGQCRIGGSGKYRAPDGRSDPRRPQLFAPAPLSTVGSTGNESTIDVFFDAPPPSALHGANVRTPAKSISVVHYDRVKVVPTSRTLACGRTATVWFVAIPVLPPFQASRGPRGVRVASL